MVAHNELQSWQRQFLANISTKSANGHNAFKEYLNKTEKYFNHSVGCRGSSFSHFIPILDNLRDIPFYFICHHFTKLVNWFTPEFWDLIVFCFFYFQFFGCLETNFGLLTKHPLSHLMLISVADFRLEGHWGNFVMRLNHVYIKRCLDRQLSNPECDEADDRKMGIAKILNDGP